jgi:pyruvate dehydrogenase E1 component alpha subunit
MGTYGDCFIRWRNERQRKAVDNMLRYVSLDGQLRATGEAVWQGLSDDFKRQMYSSMYLLRYVDQRCVALQRQGKIGTYVPLAGQEAAQVGLALALSKRDWLLPTYRDHGAALVAGVPLSHCLLHWMGRIEGHAYPEGLRVLPASVPIATHLPHAVGIAWAAKLRQQEEVAVACFGDGATSEGDFHEACNFAGVYRVPVIFFCQNNGYAISIPFSCQSATETVAERASSYALIGQRVDGNDVLAVYDVMRKQISQAKTANEPALIEAVTYRFGGHTTSDDPHKYRSEAEEGAWREKDPLRRLRLLLERTGLWSEQEQNAYHADCEQQMQAALKKVADLEKPSASHLAQHVFATEANGGSRNATADNG